MRIAELSKYNLVGGHTRALAWEKWKAEDPSRDLEIIHASDSAERKSIVKEHWDQITESYGLLVLDPDMYTFLCKTRIQGEIKIFSSSGKLPKPLPSCTSGGNALKFMASVRLTFQGGKH